MEAKAFPILVAVAVAVFIAPASAMELQTFPNDIQVLNDPSLLYAYSFEDGQFDSNTSCWKNLVTGKYDACVIDTNSTNGNVLFTSVGGAFGKGIALGFDDKLVIKNTSNMHFKDITVLMFVRFDISDVSQITDDYKWYGLVQPNSWSLFIRCINSSGEVECRSHFRGVFSSSWIFAQFGNLVSQGSGFSRWHMLAATYDHATGKMCTYLDGTLVRCVQVGQMAEMDIPSRNIFTNTGTIVGDAQSKILYDELRIYGRALSSSDVATIWKAYLEGSVDAEQIATIKQSYKMIQNLITISGTVFLIGMIYVIKRKGIDIEDTRSVSALFVGVLLLLFVVFVANDMYTATVHGLEAIKP